MCPLTHHTQLPFPKDTYIYSYLFCRLQALRFEGLYQKTINSGLNQTESLFDFQLKLVGRSGERETVHQEATQEPRFHLFFVFRIPPITEYGLSLHNQGQFTFTVSTFQPVRREKEEVAHRLLPFKLWGQTMQTAPHPDLTGFITWTHLAAGRGANAISN